MEENRHQDQTVQSLSDEHPQNGEGEGRKPSLVGKLIKWTIIIALMVVVYKCISGLQEEQKQEFFKDAKGQAIASCNGAPDCIAKVNKYFDSCIKGNYSSYKKGKYSRKYVFDLEGFRDCLADKE